MGYYDDEYTNDTGTSGVVNIGGTTQGRIDYSTDIDWIKTTLVAGTTYVFRIGQSGSMVLKLSDGTHMLAAGYGQANAGPAFEYTPATSGDYYLDVSFGYQQYTGDYTVFAAVKPADAIPGNNQTTAILAADQTVHGSFEVAGDSDWYKFHAEPGQHYLFGMPGTGNAISTLQVFDSNGQAVNSFALETAVAADYFIAVSGNRAGEYDLQSLLRTDDYTANNAAPGQLKAGGQLRGEIEYSGDTDRINIDLQAGTVYTVTLAGNDNNANGLKFDLYDAAGKFVTRVGDSDHSDAARQLTFTAQTSGTYYLTVSDYYATLSKHHGYTLTASGGTPDDYGDTTATATAIAPNITVRGQTAHAQDIDMLKVALKAGVTYKLNLSPDSSHSTATSTSAWFSLAGPDGVTGVALGRADSSFTPAADGDYYIAIHANSNTPEYYQFSIATARDDFTANASSTGRLELNGSANGTLELSGDRDWFALDMIAGQTYGVALKYAPGITLSPNFNQVALKIVDAQGHTLASATPNALSNEPALSYTATASGKYYVEIGGSTGTYLLGASLVQRDDAGNTPATAAALTSGPAINGALEVSSDIDYYKLSVTAGATYAIRLKDTVADMWQSRMEVTDSQGVEVRSVYDGSEDYTLVTASSSGDIYIKVSGESGAPVIAYQLGVTALGTDDYGRNTSTTGALEVGGAVRGVINYADDSDWFKVTLEAGVTYQFNLQGAAGGSGTLAANKVPLALYDSHNNQVSATGYYSYLSSGSTLGYTVATSGDYYVQVKPENLRDKATGSYLLSAAAIPAKPQLLGSSSGEAGLHKLTDNIVLTFNEPVRIADDSKFHLLDEAGNSFYVDLYSQRGTFSNTVAIHVPAVHLKAGVSYTLAIDSGGLVNAAGTAFEGLKNYTITTAPFAAAGTEGADYLLGLHNGATLHGGGGIDTVIYDDNDFFYHVTRNGNQVQVSYQLGPIVSDTLVDVERLLFSGKAIALDIDGHGGQAYRLYQAAFGRTPDKAGLGFWINALDKGSSLAHVAGEFVNSSEFVTRSGGAASDDATFVTLLYQNVLQRAPDAGGQQYWLDALHHGATRADLLQSFSESAENQAALVGVIGNGFEYTPYGG